MGVKTKSKIKVSVYYSTDFGRNDGPPLFYKNVLQNQLKLDTYRLIPQGDTSRFGAMDYHFVVDWGEDGLPVDHTWRIPDDGGKKIYVVSDAHFSDKARDFRINKAKLFDYTFVNQEWYVDLFKKAGVKNVHYLPHAAEPKAYPHIKTIPIYDVCFIGHIQEFHVGNSINMSRLDFLDFMFKEFPNFYYGTRNPAYPEKNMFDDAARHFNESKVVLNISIGNDVNMRFFETLCSGSFLLTNSIPALKSIEKLGLKAGEHFETYSSLDEAVSKVKYFIEHDDEREVIAKAGHTAFMKGHTYKHRVNEIFDVIASQTL